MPARDSPTIRRRELGALLRGLRTEKGWTVEQVAERMLISPSKVSRLETGQRGASARDIRDLCDLYQVDPEQRVRLTDLAAEGKQRAWWQPLALPYPTYLGLESAAVSIQDYALGIIPGLLQTAGYAREVVRAAVPRWTPEVVEQRVEGRLARQQLLAGEDAPQFHAVLDEALLHRVVGSPAIMAGQLQRLLEASRLPAVTIQVIGYEAGPLPAGNNKFILLQFAQPAIPAVVFVEGLTGDLYLESPDDVAVYAETFRALTEMAEPPDKTRELFASMIESYRKDWLTSPQ